MLGRVAGWGFSRFEANFAKRKRRDGEAGEAAWVKGGLKKTTQLGDGRDWSRLKKRTQSWLSRAQCRDFEKRSQFHYGSSISFVRNEKAPKTEKG